MKTKHTATVVDGSLKLDDPLDLPEQSRVEITVAPIAKDVDRKLEALRKFRDLSDATPLFGDAERLTRDQLHERR